MDQVLIIVTSGPCYYIFPDRRYCRYSGLLENITDTGKIPDRYLHDELDGCRGLYTGRVIRDAIDAVYYLEGSPGRAEYCSLEKFRTAFVKFYDTFSRNSDKRQDHEEMLEYIEKWVRVRAKK